MLKKMSKKIEKSKNKKDFLNNKGKSHNNILKKNIFFDIQKEIKKMELEKIEKDTILFGGTGKAKKPEEKKNFYKSLTEWTDEEIENNPSLFIENILYDIDIQFKKYNDLKLPKKEIETIFKLFKQEYLKINEDANLEKNKIILKEIENNLNSDNIDNIINELKFVKDFFRISEIFDFYAQDEKSEKNKKEISNEERAEYLKMIKGLISLAMEMDKIRDERIKNLKIFGLEAKRNDLKLENEYKDTEKEYNNLKQELIKKSNFNNEEIDGKIYFLKDELNEMNANFNKEKAEEYIAHLRKIIDYQKDYLFPEKKDCFEKIFWAAKDQKIEILSSLLIGFSIDDLGADWLIYGKNQLIDKESGDDIGFLILSMLKLRKERIEELEEKIGRQNIWLKDIDNNLEIDNKLTDKLIDKRIISVNFNMFQRLKVKNNFLEVKKRIKEI